MQINACNGRNCGETFAGPNSPTKPAVWTENWTSRYVCINLSFIGLHFIFHRIFLCSFCDIDREMFLA